MAPEVLAALITAPITVAAAVVTALGTSRAESRKIREELKLQDMAEQGVKALLEHPDWELRSFETIKRHVAIDDDDLRKLLLRAGALRFLKRRGTTREQEMWGLRTRNEHRLRRDFSEEPETSTAR